MERVPPLFTDHEGHPSLGRVAGVLVAHIDENPELSRRPALHREGPGLGRAGHPELVDRVSDVDPLPRGVALDSIGDVQIQDAKFALAGPVDLIIEVELVKDSETKGRFSREECNHLMRDILSHRLFELGLICRTEDRAEPVIQLAPPLVAGPEEFREIARILRQALTEAQDEIS